MWNLVHKLVSLVLLLYTYINNNRDTTSTPICALKSRVAMVVRGNYGNTHDKTSQLKINDIDYYVNYYVKFSEQINAPNIIGIYIFDVILSRF